MFQIHNMAGKVRIRTAVLENNSRAADGIRKALSTIRGIGTVNIDRTTGCILINYNPKATNRSEIIGFLEVKGFFDRSSAVMN